MHMLYNSDNFAVVQFVVSGPDDGSSQQEPAAARGGYEIVDKSSRKELFLEGTLAEHFKLGVEALIETSPGVEEMDAFLSNYTTLAHQPVVLH
jgi:hypothetical protein